MEEGRREEERSTGAVAEEDRCSIACRAEEDPEEAGTGVEAVGHTLAGEGWRVVGTAVAGTAVAGIGGLRGIAGRDTSSREREGAKGGAD